MRLFIQCPTELNEQDLRDEFKKWGPVENVVLIRHKDTGKPKGFGYIRYTTFYHAALAFENCSSKYKAKFADTKSSKQTSSSMQESRDEESQLSRLKKTDTSQSTSLNVVVSKSIKQDQLWRLFDIVPGLDYCQILKGMSNFNSSKIIVCFIIHRYNSISESELNNEAIVVYHNPESAIYAM